jgi:hypothetical protein
VAETIVRQGVETGEFERVDPAETAGLFMRSMVHFCHPVLLAQCLRDGDNLEAGLNSQVRFLLRAITPRS